jgi:hypothetical protein
MTKEDKLHVTLVRGPIVFAAGAINNETTPAIGFAYLAAYIMRAGYAVEIVDAIGRALNRVYPLDDVPGYMAQGLTSDEILDQIPAHTDVIGFSAMFSGEWPVVRDIITAVRERFPNALFVAGGEHVTALPEYSLRDCPAIDLIVKGEGEHTFYELLEAYREGGATGYSEIGGICFLDDAGDYRNNGQLPRIRDIDSIPWPY